MKKIEYHFWVGLFFIYTFCLNITLILLALVLNSIWFTVGAIILAALQIIFHKKFNSKEKALECYRLQSKIKALINYIKLGSAYPLMYRSAGNSLNEKQRETVIKRANNIRHAFADNVEKPVTEFTQTAEKLHPITIKCQNLQHTIGTEQCINPYTLSILNVGAIDQKKIGKDVTLALSEGAKIGGFAVNTGSDGISPHLIRGGGDLIWQISYPGNDSENFNQKYFRVNATRLYIKMIEVNIDEQSIQALKDQHAANNLILFIQKLRHLSGGKPIGIKICGLNEEVLTKLCESMRITGVQVDFITIEIQSIVQEKIGKDEIDEYYKPLSLARNVLNKYKLATTVIALGRIVDEYDVLYAIAFGAHACYTTEPMTNAVNSGFWFKKSNPISQRVRVANFQRNTVVAITKLMERYGYESLKDVRASMFTGQQKWKLNLATTQ